MTTGSLVRIRHHTDAMERSQSILFPRRESSLGYFEQLSMCHTIMLTAAVVVCMMPAGLTYPRYALEVPTVSPAPNLLTTHLTFSFCFCFV